MAKTKGTQAMRNITDLKDMFCTSVELYGNKVAYYVKDNGDTPYRAISYNRCKLDVDALGTALVNMGLSGKKIGLIGENSYEWATTYFATVCGVGVIVPFDKELPQEELDYLIKDSQVECVFYSSKFKSYFDSLDLSQTNIKVRVNFQSEEDEGTEQSYKRLIEKGVDYLIKKDRTYVDCVINPTDMCALLYTSGTSGLAKGVMLSSENLASDLMGVPRLVRVEEKDIFFSVLPLHHSFACTCDLLFSFYQGAALGFSQGLKQMLKNMEELKPTVFLGVPLIFEGMYKKIWQNIKKNGLEEKVLKAIKINRRAGRVKMDFSRVLFKKIHAVFGGSIRILVCGGAAINPKVLEGYNSLGILAVQGYGLTESSPVLTLNPEKKPNSFSAGKALYNVELKIHEPDDQGIGEIIAKGKNIMLGYYNNPTATEQVLKEGWLYTGDLGYLDKKGFLYITGRKKNVIITRNGKNVYPEELELYLLRIPYVSETLVSSKEGDVGTEIQILAQIRPDYEAIEGVLGEGYTEEQVLHLIEHEVDQLNETLPFYKKIKKVVIRNEAFAMTTTKKIKRHIENNKE